MPNPKSGTVTMEIGRAVKEVKMGKIDFRVDKFGIVHASVGRVSFEEEKLEENVREFIQAVLRLRPATLKGTYVRSIYVSSTMGPGIALEVQQQ
jgi:ribosomal protein L1p/L10e family